MNPVINSNTLPLDNQQVFGTPEMKRIPFPERFLAPEGAVITPRISHTADEAATLEQFMLKKHRPG